MEEAAAPQWGWGYGVATLAHPMPTLLTPVVGMASVSAGLCQHAISTKALTQSSSSRVGVVTRLAVSMPRTHDGAWAVGSVCGY
jgi:hypothetical protein